jgi:hypothetical protein
LQSSDATPRTIANALRFSDASLNRAAFGAPGTGDLTFTGAATLLGDLELFVNNDETEFTGAFSGAGRSVTKLGDGLLTLSGPQDYDTLTTAAGTTELDAALGSGTSTLNANAATNIGASQTLAALNIGAGAIVTLTTAAPGPLVQAIPEPATTVTLLAGLATWLGSRRRRDRTGGRKGRFDRGGRRLWSSRRERLRQQRFRTAISQSAGTDRSRIGATLGPAAIHRGMNGRSKRNVE